MRITPQHLKELSVYTVLTLGGVLVDLGTANLLVYALSIPLLISGACGLITGTITNYFIHLNITFKTKNIKSSWKFFFKYVQTCLLGAGVRLIILAILGLFSNFPSFYALIIATGASFAVNFILSKFFVFKQPS